MDTKMRKRIWTLALAVVATMALTSGPAVALDEPTKGYIVKGEVFAEVKAAVIEVGGEITHELRIIKSVGARLTESQLETLKSSEHVTQITEDRAVGTSALPTPCCNGLSEALLGFGGQRVDWVLDHS